MRYKQFLNFALMLAFCAAISLSICRAQTLTTGDVTGVVSDQTGAVLPGATVTLSNRAVGAVQTATSNNQGVYHFSLLPSGQYTVSASAPGLISDTVQVAIQVGQSSNVNLTAKVQSTSQTVEVTSAAQAVQTENANMSRTFNTAQIEDLPTPGGDITSFAFTVPGVVVNTGGGFGNFSSHGLPGTANLFTINGNDYNDPYLNLNNSGASNLLLGQNDISEASVVQNAYSVEYGRNAGAQVNFVTKSGANQFHGNLFENWNGNRLNANDYFNNLNGLPTPHAVSNQYGASLGGHIIKDKLFFFTDFESLRYVLPTSGYVTMLSPQLQQYMQSTLNASQLAVYNNAFGEFSGVASRATPTTNGTGPLQDSNGKLGCADFAGTNTAAPGGGIFGVNVPCTGAFATNAGNLNTEWLMTDRVDYNINEKNKVYFRFKVDHGNQATGTNLVNPAYNVASIQPQYEGQINYTTIFSPSVVNNFIGSVLWYSAIFTNKNISSLEQTNPFDLYEGVGGVNGTGNAGLYQLGFGYAGIGYDVFPQGRNSGQLGLVDDLSIVKGQHTIKLGANLRKNDVSDYSLQENAAGSYFFSTFTDFIQGMTNPNTGSAYSQSFAPISIAHIRLYNVGVYLQDEWNVKNNFKLTYGVRMERTANPTCVENCFSRYVQPFGASGYVGGTDTPYNQTIETGLQHAYASTQIANFDPRVGIVWSPHKGNSTVIRAGGGLFSDLPPGGIVASVFENQPFLYTATVFNGEVGNTADGNSATAGALNQYNAYKSGFAAGQTLGQLQNSVPGGFSPSNFFSTPQELKTPEYAEWSFEIQQPLGQKNVFVATYAGNHGYNLLLSNPFVNTSVNTNNYTSFGSLPLTAPDARFNGVTQLINSGISNYNGVTVQFRRSFSYGFQGQIGYTWSHALDDISSLPGEPFSFANSLTTLNTPTPMNNYSNSDTDIRHNLVADFIWETPWKSSHRGVGSLLGGWTVGSKFFYRTGSPFSAIAGSGVTGALSPAIGPGGVILADVLNSSISKNCGTSAVSAPCYTSTDFACPIGLAATTGCTPQTNFGNLPRNSFYGPGYFDIDTTLAKDFHITERMKLQFSAQAYNLLNHPNFGNPILNVTNGAFGTIQSTVSAPTSPYGSFQGSAVSGRVLVVGGKFEF